MPLPCAILLGVVIGVGLVLLLAAAPSGHRGPVTPRPPPPWRVPAGYQPRGDATPHGPLPDRGSNGTPPAPATVPSPR